ncbi:helix-turn-helix transcriptional regulator [Parasphingorhabdus sp.]|uniref:helix-turn-helix domain-containing protein n=1 Tax=Parasphingorhabdus sp. TaxID=2709688 RepID=UPI0032659B3B
MGQPSIEKLTEKEKVVLRLLLRGYDAKTAAYELDITPNSVNERLRSTRRKLGVTSSREAARLFAASDSEDPKFFGYKEIGIAETPDSPPIHALSEQQAKIGQDDNMPSTLREMQTPYEFAPLNRSMAWSIPFLRQGDVGNDLSKRERIKAIADITAKLATTFALICLAAVLISTLISRT